MVFDDFLAESQTDAGPGVFVLRVQALEDEEDPVGVRGVDADAVVAAGELPGVTGALRGDPRLHVGRSARGSVGGGENRHDLVADRLDDAAAAVHARLLDDREAALDGGERLRIAQGFVELCAAADVGEQDGEVARRFFHGGALKYKPRGHPRCRPSRHRGIITLTVAERAA